MWEALPGGNFLLKLRYLPVPFDRPDVDRVWLRIWSALVELASELIDEKMGLPSRFGLAMAQGGGEDEAHRGGEVDAMAGGDVDGSDAVPGSDDHSDDLRGDLQPGGSPASEGRRCGLAG